jgi:Helix-turn-helix domain
MTLECLPGIEAQFAEMRSMLAQILGMLAQPMETREWYPVEEVAAMLGKNTYTVREWCRLGRINATKRSERRGGTELWNISAAEIARYKDEGLLPLDLQRNADC